ncbi:hypothetical protein B0H14DRAFT_2560588 [Mycena olivaceomarginata]|nr:hypothetical protein B0H14DRAFT_2560588 [Mycena olivaceomarginata]
MSSELSNVNGNLIFLLLRLSQFLKPHLNASLAALVLNHKALNFILTVIPSATITGNSTTVLWLVVVPGSRLSDTIGHVFLDMVSKYGVQVTFDGGSELGNMECRLPSMAVASWAIGLLGDAEIAVYVVIMH